MTTIVACTKDGVHALAADSRITSGAEIVGESYLKLIKLGSAVVGTSGDGPTGGLVERMNEVRTVHEFVKGIKHSMLEAGYKVDSEEDGPPRYGQGFFFMNDDGIWEVFGYLDYALVHEDFPTAIGSGRKFAVGAMEISRTGEGGSIVLPMSQVAINAVRVAMRRDSGTGGNIMLAVRGKETYGPKWI